MFEFRSKDRHGKLEVYSRCENPGFIVDSELVVRIKYGEFDKLLEILPRYSGFNCVVIEAPKDQELLDKLFQSSGYFQKYYSEFFRINGVIQS